MGEQFERENASDFLAFVGSVLRHSYAQRFQDLWFLWETGFASSGYFCEFGALNGKDFSNTYTLEKLGWQGVVAEPHPDYEKWMRQNRGCAISTKCVYDRTGDTVVFHAVRGRPALSAIGSEMVNDDKANLRNNYEEVRIATITLADLFGEARAPATVDCLSIDTEGSEFTILEAYDFASRRINCICVEHNGAESRDKIHGLLLRNGYRRKWTEVSGHDDWYILEDAYPHWNGDLRPSAVTALAKLPHFETAYAEREKLLKSLS